MGLNRGVNVVDNIQQIPNLPHDLSHQQSPVDLKNAYRVGNGDQVANWPQMPTFPMKPLDFQQNLPPMLQYQSSILQSQLKNQPQYVWPSGPNLSDLSSQLNSIRQNHNNEEVLPDKDVASDRIRDVPVADRKKDGKHLIESKIEIKSTEDSDYNNQDEEETTTEPPKKKKKHRKVNKIGKQPSEELTIDSSKQQLNVLHSGLQSELVDHNGKADRPGGAVVSLALGLFNRISE